jgi:hypothetical protein
MMVGGLSACAHSIYLPNTPHQIPVVAGKRWGGKVGFDFSTAAQVPLFSDVNVAPPTRVSNGTIGSVSGAGSALVAALGLFEPIDFYLSGGLGLRFQFLGLAPEEKWKASVFAGSIGGRETELSTNQGPSNQVSAKTQTSGWEYGASLGYLANDELLLYSTYLHRGGKGVTTITQPNNVVFEYNDRFSLQTLVFGLNFGQEWYFNFEFGSSSVNWDNSTSGRAFASNIGFGYQW